MREKSDQGKRGCTIGHALPGQSVRKKRGGKKGPSGTTEPHTPQKPSLGLYHVEVIGGLGLRAFASFNGCHALHAVQHRDDWESL